MLSKNIENTGSYRLIQLSSSQMEECHEAARYRQAEAARLGQRDSRDFGRSELKDRFDIQVNSFAAELAFSMYLGIPPQTGVNQGSRPDIICDNKNIHVKCNANTYGNLNVPEYQIKRTANDYYFLARPTDTYGQFFLIGYVAGKDIPKYGEITTYGNGRKETYKVAPSKLKPFTKYGNQ